MGREVRAAWVAPASAVKVPVFPEQEALPFSARPQPVVAVRPADSPAVVPDVAEDPVAVQVAARDEAVVVVVLPDAAACNRCLAWRAWRGSEPIASASL